jgi:hypothetical protein
MTPNILIVRDGERYRVLHGLLHLTSHLNRSTELFVDVPGEGVIKIIRTPLGFLVHTRSQHVPLLLN